MFENFGFGRKLRDCLHTYLKNTSYFVLLNASPGLRQGNPLSPRIFILAVEVLIQMFLKAQSVGYITVSRSIEIVKVSQSCSLHMIH